MTAPRAITAFAPLFAGLWLCLSLAAPAAAGQVTVFAAASLKDALEEIAKGFTAETGRRAALSFAGSSVLARQVEHGAPADVFISANVAWMDHLVAKGLIDPETRFALAGNRLALISHRAAPATEIGPGLDLAAMLGGGRLAMALVDAVPAGIYGKAALTRLGLWSGVAPHVAQTDNVRAALALVAAGEAPLGIVYATDAAAEARVSIIGLFPESSHPPIRYPAAAVTGGEGAAFLAYLRADAARAALARRGFLTDGD